MGSAPLTADATPGFPDIGARVAVGCTLGGIAASHVGSIGNAGGTFVTYQLFRNGIAVAGWLVSLPANVGLPAVVGTFAGALPVVAGDLLQMRVMNRPLAVAVSNIQVTAQ